MTGSLVLKTLAASWWLPMLLTIGVVLGVQWTFWIMAAVASPSANTAPQSLEKENTMITSIKSNDQGNQKEIMGEEELLPSSTEETSFASNQKGEVAELSILNERNSEKPEHSDDGNNSTNKRSSSVGKDVDDDDEYDYEKDLFRKNDQWRCACEGGFLLPGMLKSFAGANAVMRLGAGQCYHKEM